jgi:hypothetical protein
MAEPLDLAALEEAARLLHTARNADRWFEYTNACSRLSTWLTEHAADLLRLARLGLEHERMAATLATREADVDAALERAALAQKRTSREERR